MALFEEHIKQAKKNLDFLKSTSNNNVSDFWDWKVTICFYTAVHLVNAHISSKMNHHYRSHDDVNKVLNPFNRTSIAIIPENYFTAYIKLSNLSRRSRYLVSDDMGVRDIKGFFTSEKHFAKAVRNFDILMTYFVESYILNFDKTILNCDRIKNDTLNYFENK